MPFPKSELLQTNKRLLLNWQCLISCQNKQCLAQNLILLQQRPYWGKIVEISTRILYLGNASYFQYFPTVYQQWIIAKGPMVNWPIAFTKCYGAIPVSYGTIGDKSAQKREYGMRGAIAFDEIGIDSWYVRTSDGSIAYGVYVGYFGIGIVKGNTDH